MNKLIIIIIMIIIINQTQRENERRQHIGYNSMRAGIKTGLNRGIQYNLFLFFI